VGFLLIGRPTNNLFGLKGRNLLDLFYLKEAALLEALELLDRCSCGIIPSSTIKVGCAGFILPPVS
jgi:hypothetical protein